MDELPTYEGSGPRPPAASAPRPEYPTKHSFVHVLSGKDTCTITVASRAPNPGSPPVFYPGDTVSGAVELVLTKKLALKAVEVKVSVRNEFAYAVLSEDDIEENAIKAPFTAELPIRRRRTYHCLFITSSVSRQLC